MQYLGVRGFSQGKTPHAGAALRAKLGFSWALMLTQALVSTGAMAAASQEADRLVDLPLEQLMDMEISGASKYVQKRSEAPSAVTVITAADIKAYGYRTLSDVMKSIRGLYVNYDRNYSFIGIRGFGRSGDYNSRVLMLIDGYRINDATYDSASFGTEFPLDLELIDRVEFIPGPGSALYGSNAFFGVINIITKSGKDLNGTELAGEGQSFNTARGRGMIGKHLSNGLDFVLGGSTYKSGGQDLFFPEWDSPATNNGRAAGRDGDSYSRLFGKLAYGGFRLEAVFSDRTKEIPTGSFGTVFNDPASHTNDQNAFFDLSYYRNLAPHTEASAHAFYGRYSYTADYAYANPSRINRDLARTQWWGLEAKLVSRYFKRHHLVLGGEYQDNVQQDQTNFDQAPFFAPYINTERDTYRFGIYGQDDFQITDKLHLNAGLRYDYYSIFGDTINPRLGLIYTPQTGTTLKFLYGTAFRAPNVYELDYFSPVLGQKANPDLQPEEITTYEAIIELQPRDDLRLTFAGFRYEIDGLISQIRDPADGLLVFRNAEDLTAWGAEFQAETQWRNGLRGRFSYTWTSVEDKATGQRPANSPEHLLKLNLTAPLYKELLRVGLETQYTSSRTTIDGDRVAEFPVVNLTLTSQDVIKGLGLSFTVFNLFDKDYADVAGEEHCTDSTVALGCLRAIRQDGPVLRGAVSFKF